jgi:HEAT repeat protein
MTRSDYLAHIADSVREARRDPRSEHELVSIALTEPDEDLAWEAVSILHRRGSREALEAARQLCASDCPIERTLGVNILGQLGIPTRAFPEETVALLLGVLQAETDKEVLAATCIAFGHTHDPRAVPEFARLRTHPSANIRYAVAFGLDGYTEPEAIETLIELSADPDDLVRDWATFGLTELIDVDTPAIREALWLRVTDPDELTRGQALLGLARRRDQRVIEPLTRELRRYPEAEYGGYALEAAEEISEPRLLPILLELKQGAGANDRAFNAAIVSCSR